MNLKHLTDGQLQLDTQNLVQNERALLTQILYHLKEIETRKLFASFGYKSLFEYACVELKYSADQAFRRIQAMRLLKEIPETAQKIESGELRLSNINQAQKYFKQASVVSKNEKIEVLKKLCDKSVREGQKEILKLTPLSVLPEETKKQVSPNFTHVSFNMSDELESKFEAIKSLLGAKSYHLSLAELIEAMANLAHEKLTEKKFGKRQLNSNPIQRQLNSDAKHKSMPTFINKDEIQDLNNSMVLKISGEALALKRQVLLKSQDEDKVIKTQTTLNVQSTSASKVRADASRKYISKSLKYTIWQRDNYKCNKCSSQVNLQIDHIKPLALGGATCDENLRLLCFNCNQRSRIEAQL